MKKNYGFPAPVRTTGRKYLIITIPSPPLPAVPPPSGPPPPPPPF